MTACWQDREPGGPFMSRPFDVSCRSSWLISDWCCSPLTARSVTLSRITNGVKVVADGLEASDVNASGLFVWLKEPRNLRKIRSIRDSFLRELELTAAE